MAIFTAISAVGAGLAAVGSLVGGGALAGAAIVGGTAATAYGVTKTVKSTKQAAAASRATTAAIEVQQKQQAATETRKRRAAIRQTLRISKAQQAARAGGAGVGVSAMGGFRGSLFSQLGANLGFGSMMSGLSAERSAFSRQASILGGQAQYSAALGGLGFQLGSMFMPQGGFGALGLSSTFEPNMSRTTPYTDVSGLGVG